jgi:DNA-binding response OmpR family regulator
MSGETILVVVDKDDVRELLRRFLERAGLAYIEAEDGHAAVRCFFERRPDMVILDTSMPGLDGWEVLQRIRGMSEAPVLMLTASREELEEVRGLHGGADDFLTKPFGGQELIARIEALLRRRRGRAVDPEDAHVDALLEIDFAGRSVTVRGSAIEVTPTEFKLLALLAAHPGQVLSRDQILEKVWGNRRAASSHEVTIYVSYLRRKLREAAGVEPITTVRGFGYRYDPA